MFIAVILRRIIPALSIAVRMALNVGLGLVLAYAYRVVQKKRYPGFNFAITSVNVHRF